MFESVKSVVKQTTPVDMVVLLTKKPSMPAQTEPLPDVLRDLHGKIDLATFDYILAVDEQLVLPEDFLEKSLTKEPDTLTSAGCQILKVKPFLAREKGVQVLKKEKGIRIFCLILSLPQQLRFETIQSVMRQSVPVEMVVLLTKKSKMPTLIERIVDAENLGLRHVNLKEFDYLFKLDADTILGRDFLKNNLSDNPDAVGPGPALLVKVSEFMEVLDGKFRHIDDCYVMDKFRMEGKNYHRWSEEPKFTGHHFSASGESLDVPYLVGLGRMYYRLGHMPMQVFHSVFWEVPYSIRNIFTVGGYLMSFILRPKKLDTYNFMKKYQTKTNILHRWAQRRNILNITTQPKQKN
jgi:hypothetical protein